MYAYHKLSLERDFSFFQKHKNLVNISGHLLFKHLTQLSRHTYLSHKSQCLQFLQSLLYPMHRLVKKRRNVRLDHFFKFSLFSFFGRQKSYVYKF